MFDYTHLMGKIIDYKFFKGGVQQSKRGLVAAIDPNIGVTIVNAADNEEYLSCLRLPGSPLWNDRMCADRAMATFYCIATMIINDTYDDQKVSEVYRAFATEDQRFWQDMTGQRDGGNPSANTCAF